MGGDLTMLEWIKWQSVAYVCVSGRIMQLMVVLITEISGQLSNMCFLFSHLLCYNLL